MNPMDLPRVGVISNHEKDFYGKFMDLHSLKVLCIGFSEPEIDAYIAKYQPASIEVLTLWIEHIDARISKYPLTIGDISKRTKYADNTFDAVVTLSLLEHLKDLRGAFFEMKRITKDGGVLLHMFGPAWSSAYGHHLYANPNHHLLNFALWDMPAHMHLLCDQEEIINFYVESGLGADAGRVALYWFYESDGINRIFYDDYLRIIQEADFQVDRMEIMHNVLPSNHLTLLRSRFQNRHDFSTYGGKYKLIVRKSGNVQPEYSY